MQAILTQGSSGFAVGLPGFAMRVGPRERTPFNPFLILSALVGAFAEPLYDARMMR